MRGRVGWQAWALALALARARAWAWACWLRRNLALLGLTTCRDVTGDAGRDDMRLGGGGYGCCKEWDETSPRIL
jgi:hypothetical protein